MPVSARHEIDGLLAWLGSPPRTSAQIGAVGETDSELIGLPGGRTLAINVDAISEEILVGLYREPYTMGWVAATAALSDLAASGANPLGFLFSSIFARESSLGYKQQVAAGLADALRAAHVALLGGDSGSGAATVLNGIAVGLCERTPLTRRGVLPGDYLCLVGQLGIGAALALRFLRNEPVDAFPETHYRPRVRLDAGQALAAHAHASMDTSDGLFMTLDTLAAINRVGFALDWTTELLAPSAIDYCTARGLPLFSLWCAEHGDFQLVIALPENDLKTAQEKVSDLFVIGRATADGQSSLRVGQRVYPLDLPAIRTVLVENHWQPRVALEQLMTQFKQAELP